MQENIQFQKTQYRLGRKIGQKFYQNRSNQSCTKTSTRHRFCNDEYVDFDRELSTTQRILTEKNIIHEVLGNSAEVSSDEDDMKVSEAESIRKPLIEEVRTVTEILDKFNLYSKFGDMIMKSTIISIEKNKTRKQSNNREFFKKIDL